MASNKRKFEYTKEVMRTVNRKEIYKQYKHYSYISPLVFSIRLSYNLPVYLVLLCNCSVLSVVSLKNENYKKKQKKINKIQWPKEKGQANDLQKHYTEN